MKKSALIVFVSFIINNCTFLATDHYLYTEAENSESKRDHCGYFSVELMSFGLKNKTTIQYEDYVIELCSKVYYTKDIAAGFIVPIIPFKRDWSEEDRYLKISNISSKNNISLDSTLFNSDTNYTIRITDSIYPDGFINWKVISSEVIIKPNKQVWISIPQCEKIQLNIKVGEIYIPIRVKEKIGYSIWMLTV